MGSDDTSSLLCHVPNLVHDLSIMRLIALVILSQGGQQRRTWTQSARVSLRSPGSRSRWPTAARGTFGAPSGRSRSTSTPSASRVCACLVLRTHMLMIRPYAMHLAAVVAFCVCLSRDIMPHVAEAEPLSRLTPGKKFVKESLDRLCNRHVLVRNAERCCGCCALEPPSTSQCFNLRCHMPRSRPVLSSYLPHAALLVTNSMGGLPFSAARRVCQLDCTTLHITLAVAQR